MKASPPRKLARLITLVLASLALGSPAWATNYTITDLGALISGDYSRETGINNNGQVVGQSDTAAMGRTHAFLYSEGSLLDLNNLLTSGSGWTLTDARDINDLGQIVGTGFINGYDHAFLMTPSAVPAPSSAWLLGSGLMGLIGVARRRR